MSGVPLDPLHASLLINRSSGDTDHELDCVGWIGFEVDPVDREEGHCRSPRKAFVPIGEWMVVREPNAEHRRFLSRRRMEVLVAESGPRCMKCRVEQLDTRSRLQRVGADPRHGLGDHERFGECQEPHWARRSRIS